MAQSKSADAPVSGRGPILIVEDDDLVAELLEFKLTAEGYDTHVVHGGSAALDYLEGTTPSCIVLDLVMPGVDGIQLLSRLSEDGRVEEFPIIVLTGREDDEVVSQAFKLGAADYVTKPFSPAALVARIRRVLH